MKRDNGRKVTMLYLVVLTLLSQKPLLSSGRFAQIVRPDELSTCDIKFIAEYFIGFLI